MIHHFEFWEDDCSTSMVGAKSPYAQKGLMPEWNPRKVGETKFACRTRECKPLEMCWECNNIAGQRYYDFFGLGTYTPPERW